MGERMILTICHLMSACLSLELTGKHAKSRRLFRRWDRLGPDPPRQG